MQYLLMIYSAESDWDRLTESERQEKVAAYQAYTESLRKADVVVGMNRLQHTNTATTVRLIDSKPQVLDGPYCDSKEQLAGYYLIDVPNLDAAIAWAARCPGASHGAMEVRPIWTIPYEAAPTA
ncbi:YciI family protein [Trinickia acidisoli]|uniref:YciI family protein n=1 Tax=Trinickia acidisoli TaxID=2767482 RepID=UPI001A8E7B86|nr:YciI family protein [Trinickia acidisoli]